MANNGENIDLGSFSWDISAIEKQLIDNRKQLEGYSNALKFNKDILKQQSKEIQEAAKTVVLLKEMQNELNKALQEGTISEEDYMAAMDEVNKEMEETKKRTDEIVNSQTDLIKTNLELERTMKSLQQENRNLNTLMEGGRTEASENATAYKDLNKELNALKLEAKNLGAELVLMERSGDTTSEAYQALKKRWQEASEAADELNDQFKDIDKAVGDTQRSVGDYRDQIISAAKEIGNLSSKQADLKSEQNNLDKEFRQGNISLEEYNQKSEALGKSIDKLTSRIEELKAAEAEAREELIRSGQAQEFYQNQVLESISGIREGIGEIISGNVTGGISNLKESLTGLKDTFGNLFNFLKANPWIVLVGALVLYTKELIEHNAEIAEANKEVEQLANTTGELTNQLRQAGAAISETFDNKSFEDAVTEMDQLMDDFKISSTEAWNTYVEGLARGGAANDEFGDSIKEYGALFAQNGYSAQQFINILNTGINLGIYSDKLPDAIKEAGLALNEQTKATRDALINAFGAPFSDELLKRVQQGRTTVAQALDEIADKAEKTNLNQQQQAQLTADLFKGAGEDAGGSLVIFDALNKAQDITSDNLTELQKKTIELTNLNLEVAKAKDEAFSSDSVRTMRKDLEVLWKNIQIGFYRSLGYVSEFLQGAGNGFQLFGRNTIDVFKAIPKGFNEVSKSIGNDIDKIAQLGSTAGDVLKKAFTLDVEGAKSSYNSLRDQLKNFNSDTLNSLSKVDDYLASINSKNVNLIKAQNAARAEAQKLEDEAEAKKANNKTTGATGDAEAKAAADAAKAAEAERKKAETKRLADAKKAKAEAEKEATELAKKDLEIQRDKAQQSTDIAKGELAEYIRINSEKYKDDKKLTEQKLKDQLDYFDEVARKQKEANRLEKESKELAIQQKIDELEKKKELNQVELDDIATLKMSISILSREAAEADAEVDKQVYEKKKETNKQFNDDLLEQQRLARAIQYQQEIIMLEEQGGQEYEIRRIQLEQQTQLEVEEFLKKNGILLEEDQANYDVQQEIALARKELADQMQATDDENERLRIQNQLDQLGLMQATYADKTKKIQEASENAKLQAIASTFGQAKGLFKENTLAYKAMAVAEAAISTYLSVTKTLAEYPGPVGWAMSAVQIALGLAQVAKIVSVQPGYADGGYTGDGGKYQPAGIVHKGEVVWSQADVAAVGGAAVANAMRPTYGGYFNGGVVGVSSIPSVQSAIMGSNVTVSLDDNSVSLVADAIYAGSQAGIGDMADNASIRMGANFG